VATADIEFTGGYATVTVETTAPGVLTPGFHGLHIHSVGKCEANSVAPTGGRELRRLLEFASGHRRYDQLRNPISRVDCICIPTQIHQENHQLSAIVGVDRARCIDHGHTRAQRQTRSRTNLSFVAGRNLQHQPCRHREPCPRFQ